MTTATFADLREIARTVRRLCGIADLDVWFNTQIDSTPELRLRYRLLQPDNTPPNPEKVQAVLCIPPLYLSLEAGPKP